MSVLPDWNVAVYGLNEAARLVWVGYVESEDVFYANAAKGWFLGATHCSIRRK